MSFWKKLKKIGKKIVNGASDTVNTVASGAKHAASTVINTTVDVGKTVYQTGKTVTDATGKAAVDGWEATSHEAFAIGTAIESTGLQLSDGVVYGAKKAEEWGSDGVEYGYEGLVMAGDYLNQQACDIALGSALGAVFAALAADEEEVAECGSVAALCAAQLLDNVMLNVAASALAPIIAEPVFRIPGVSKAVNGDKKLLTDIIAFVIFKCAKEDPEMVVSTAGQYFAGAIIAVVTTLVCDGTLPGGFKVWRGAYKPIKI